MQETCMLTFNAIQPPFVIGLHVALSCAYVHCIWQFCQVMCRTWPKYCIEVKDNICHRSAILHIQSARETVYIWEQSHTSIIAIVLKWVLCILCIWICPLYMAILSGDVQNLAKVLHRSERQYLPQICNPAYTKYKGSNLYMGLQVCGRCLVFYFYAIPWPHRCAAMLGAIPSGSDHLLILLPQISISCHNWQNTFCIHPAAQRG